MISTVREAINDTGRLRAVAAIDFDDPGLRHELDAIAAVTAARAGLPVSLVSLVMNAAQLVAGSAGLEGTWLAEAEGVPIEWAPCAYAVATKSLYVVDNAVTDPVQSTNPLVTMGLLGSYAGVPITVDGHVVGAFCLLGDTPHTFTEAELDELRSGSATVTAALRRHHTPAPIG